VRRLLGSWTIALGLVGVPIVAMLATGGLETFGFWLGAWLQLAMWAMWGSVLAIPMVIAVAVLTIPVGFVIYRFAEEWVERLGMAVYALACVGATSYLFVLRADLAGSVRLPVADEEVGALLVMAGVIVVMLGLVGLGAWLKGDPIFHLPSLAVRVEPVAFPQSPIPYRPVSSAPEPGSPPVTDREDAILAWRVWGWNGDVLVGVMEQWRSAVKIAQCPTCLDVPGWGHTCGIYAVKSAYDRPQRAASQDQVVVGRVELYGDIVEHEWGYRSSRAVIKELWAPTEDIFLELTMRYPDVIVWRGHLPGLNAEEIE